MKHIVITGASQGIGEAIATAWAATFPESRISLLARNHVVLERMVKNYEKTGVNARAFPVDITDSTAVADTCRMLLQECGTPDILVNNAGAFAPGGITDTDLDVFEYQIRVNLTSAFQITSLLIPDMIKARTGHVFFIGSVASIKGYPGGIAYCSAKHGLLGLARTIREETRSHGIRVTSLLPGAVRTAMWDGTEYPDERFMPPEDIANALLDAYKMSNRTVIEELILRPQLGDI